MANNYTISLTDEQKAAFETVTFDIKEWIENFAHERARVAIDDMIKNLVEHCNANEIALSVGRPAQIQQAVALGLATKIQAPDTDLKG